MSRHWAVILAGGDGENRGTVPAIVYALVTLAARQATGDTVVFYPSDHFLSDDAAFAFGGLLASGARRPARPPRRPARARSTLERPGRSRARAGRAAVGPEDDHGRADPGVDLGLTRACRRP